jgi:hypothetical protein
MVNARARFEVMKLLWTVFVLSAFILAGCAADAEDPPVFAATPAGARFVTSDIDAFWAAYDAAFSAGNPEERVRAFQRGYVDAGTDELRWMFGNKFCRSVPLSFFVDRIVAARTYYDAVRAASATVKSEATRARVRSALDRLEELYPEAVYPDLYFMVGDLSNGGSFSGTAVDLAIEAFLADADTPLTGVPEDFLPFIQGVDYIPGLVIHEVVHVQQRYLPPDRDTLLAHSIIEGGANFVEELVCGRPDNATLRAYGDAHEAELWSDFKKVMDGRDFTGWLYGPCDERETNSGYYVGYRICEAYYAKASDKHQALVDMMNLEDGAAFLEQSGYSAKFP